MKKYDPLQHGFYYVEYSYMNRKLRACYFHLEDAQSGMLRMIQRGVECHGLHEWKSKKS